MTQPVKSQKP